MSLLKAGVNLGSEPQILFLSIQRVDNFVLSIQIAFVPKGL